MKQQAELLAPAGSVEALYAAYAAGADAVYVGGGSFGARAYADNPSDEELLRAIDYAHLHQKKLYLTVNTLLKEQELEEQLYRYILPFYRQGLDAAIVQDFGVLRRLREWFPALHIHASTQMTISGALSAAKLKELGVTRIVTPRELSLTEIKAISGQTELEIESFVHGALCYCYSGQCLFSSIAGGRSGNRGRCAQPCRMPYSVECNEKVICTPKNGYVLSPKDLCALELLPQILEAGVYSLKIEGRMKKAEYTAGVVSIYRKYLDQCLERPGEPFHVRKEDMTHLLELFNRKGFTDGYYTKHNQSSMITFTKPDFRTTDEVYQKQLQERYIGKKLKENIKGIVRIFQGEPAILYISAESLAEPVTVTGDLVMPAQKQPLTEEAVRKQLEKMGDTDYCWQELAVETDGQSFYPVGKLNELRRNALEALTGAMLQSFRRTDRAGQQETAVREEIEKAVRSADTEKTETEAADTRKPKTEAAYMIETKPGKTSEKRLWCASVETKRQLEQILREVWIQQINLESHICEASELAALTQLVHQSGKSCYLTLPQVFREEDKTYYKMNLEAIRAAGLDGITAGNLEGLLFAKELLPQGRVAAEASLYGWNRAAKEALRQFGCITQTLPAELNRRELQSAADTDSMLMVYGRLPMMVSAQCVCRNTQGCRRQPWELTLVDRMGNRFPVKNRCRECYNTIYNNRPVSLADEWRSVELLPLRGYLLSFTTEEETQMQEVLSAYRELAYSSKTDRKLTGMTKGHYRRGTE